MHSIQGKGLNSLHDYKGYGVKIYFQTIQVINGYESTHPDSLMAKIGLNWPHD